MPFSHLCLPAVSRALDAGAATSGDPMVGEIGLEVVALPEIGRKALANAQIVDLDHCPTVVTDEMNVRRLVGVMVAGDAVGEMRVRDESKLFEKDQRSVDGAPVHVGKASVDLLVDLLGSNVAGGRFEELDDELPLRCEAIATLAKDREQAAPAVRTTTLLHL